MERERERQRENNDIGSLLMVRAISRGDRLSPSVEALQSVLLATRVAQVFSSYEVIVSCS